MQDRSGRISDIKFAPIVAGMICVIVYGSLYPFHFRASPDPRSPLHALIGTWRGPFGRGDFLANVLLYVPLGLFAVGAIRRVPAIARFILASVSGLVLSGCIELIQFYDDSRVSALGDVYANAIGVAVGSAAGIILFRRLPLVQVGKLGRCPFVLLLLSSWLGYRLFPYVPTIDLHKYWTAVKPLVFSPVFPPLDVYRHTVVWLAVALLIEALFGIARSRFVLPLLVPTVLFARIVIVDAVLSPAEVAGGIIAVLAWIATLSRIRLRAPIVAVLFAGMVVIESLQPFRFSAVARPFGWVPFESFMYGSLEINVSSFFEKVFTYGGLIWLIVKSGTKFTLAVGLSSGLVLCLRLSQVFLPGRSAEITDLVMVLIVAGVMKALGNDRETIAQPNVR